MGKKKGLPLWLVKYADEISKKAFDLKSRHAAVEMLLREQLTLWEEYDNWIGGSQIEDVTELIAQRETEGLKEVAGMVNRAGVTYTKIHLCSVWLHGFAHEEEEYLNGLSRMVTSLANALDVDLTDVPLSGDAHEALNALMAKAKEVTVSGG